MAFLIDSSSLPAYIAMLVFLTVASCAGLWAKKYKDNFLQNLGMTITAISCAIEIAYVIRYDSVSKMMLGILIGYSFYAAGTFLKHALKEYIPEFDDSESCPKPDSMFHRFTSVTPRGHYKAK